MDANHAEPWFEGYAAGHHDVGGGQWLHARVGGQADAPPMLLLHGFPPTHVMWRPPTRPSPAPTTTGSS
jgi:pimeloyl-ACP methyl ester carboxylesterase